MSRYIDADRLQQTYKEIHGGKRSLLIDTEPTADVRENVKGKWQPIEVQLYFKKHFDTSVACSVCHRKGNKRWNFCPNCGARMEGKS